MILVSNLIDISDSDWGSQINNNRGGNHDKLLFVRVGGQRIIMEEANDNNIILGHLSF